MKPELLQRLADLRLDVDDAVADRHLAAMHTALLEAPGAVDALPVRTRPRVRVFRPAIVAVAAAVVLSFPLAALASDDAMPGDPLYPVKRSLEWVRSPIDPDVAARHRVEELENAVHTDAPPWVISERLADASASVVGGSPELEERLERVRLRIRQRGQVGADQSPEGESRSEGDVREPAGPGDPRESLDPIESPAPSDSGSTTSASTSAPASGAGDRDRNRIRDGDTSSDDAPSARSGSGSDPSGKGFAKP